MRCDFVRIAPVHLLYCRLDPIYNMQNTSSCLQLDKPRKTKDKEGAETGAPDVPLNLKAIDLGATSSAADVIFSALCQAIGEGELQDGDLLRQDQIATMFNVSRIPVREALARLEEQGLVTVKGKTMVVLGAR